jgi:hypothetical protein
MKTATVKAIELIMDWNLWPRHMAQKLDATNVARMKEALRNGFPLPPVLVNKADNRIIDGFHRTKAALSVFGDEAEIEVIYKEYENEAEMFLDAGVTNAHQGLPMSPQDKAHFIARCRKYKIPPARIAEALHMDVKKMQKFLKERTAKTQDGETIALPYGVAKALSGKKLTPEQEHTARTSNGVLPEMYISMLINALRSESVVIKPKTIARLQELYDLIEAFIAEEAA